MANFSSPLTDIALVEVKKQLFVLTNGARRMRLDWCCAANTGAQRFMVRSRYWAPSPWDGYHEGTVLFYGHCACGFTTSFASSEFEVARVLLSHVKHMRRVEEEFVNKVLA